MIVLFQFIDTSLLTCLIPNVAYSPSLGDSIDNTGFSDQNHQFEFDVPEQTINGSESNIYYDSSQTDLSWSDHSAQSAVYPLPKELANSSCSASPYRPQAVFNGFCNDTTQLQEEMDTSFTVPSVFSSNLAAGPRQYPGMLSISRSQWTTLIPMLDYWFDQEADSHATSSLTTLSSQPPLYTSHILSKRKYLQSKVQTSRLVHDCGIDSDGWGTVPGQDKVDIGISMDCSQNQNDLAIGNRTQEQMPVSRALENWYTQHSEDPYPTAEEKLQLAIASGKSTK